MTCPENLNNLSTNTFTVIMRNTDILLHVVNSFRNRGGGAVQKVGGGGGGGWSRDGWRG